MTKHLPVLASPSQRPVPARAAEVNPLTPHQGSGWSWGQEVLSRLPAFQSWLAESRVSPLEHPGKCLFSPCLGITSDPLARSQRGLLVALGLGGAHRVWCVKDTFPKQASTASSHSPYCFLPAAKKHPVRMRKTMPGDTERGQAHSKQHCGHCYLVCLSVWTESSRNGIWGGRWMRRMDWDI